MLPVMVPVIEALKQLMTQFPIVMLRTLAKIMGSPVPAVKSTMVTWMMLAGTIKVLSKEKVCTNDWALPVRMGDVMTTDGPLYDTGPVPL